MEIKPTYVIDRQKLADAIHGVLDEGIRLLGQEEFKSSDHAKMKVMRTMGSHVNSAVAMVQQETAMVRAHLVQERMKQLGYADAQEVIEDKGA